MLPERSGRAVVVMSFLTAALIALALC